MRTFSSPFQKWLSLLSFFIAFVLSSLVLPAHAGLKVLGVEIGVSTLEQVRKQAAASGAVKNGGTNTWSEGPTLEVPGSSYEIQGLNSVLYIFTPDEKLTAVVMTMQNHRFDEIFDVLAGKYKMIKKERPFVGNNFAKFSAPDSIIELDAPHLSFEMQVRYMSSSFSKAWRDGLQSQRQQKRNNDKSSF